MVSALDQKTFQANPSLFLEKAIKEYVVTSPANRLPAFGDEPIFDEPLVGFADGDDPIFQQYKTVIGDFHLTPREALAKWVKEQPARVGVISWIMPITYRTRLTLRRETAVPSLRWNHTRWQGEELMDASAHFVVRLLEELGHQAVIPGLAESFEVRELPNGRASNWSERHIAYAAGLGTFSLSDGFITPKGIAMRCRSVVCDVALTPTPRTCENHLSNCLFYRGISCRRCIGRCPAGAISERGHDKNKCRQFMNVEQKEILQRLGRDQGYIGRYHGCGLCQTKVPCEGRIPPGIPVKSRQL